MSLRKMQDMFYNLGTTNIWGGGRYLAKNADNLLYLPVRHSLTNAAKDDQSSRLQGRVVLECKPAIKRPNQFMKACMFIHTESLIEILITQE